MSLSFQITPLLSVGLNDTAETYLDMDEAANHILLGEPVNVVTLTMAKDVLERLGLPRADAEDRIHFAVTGKVMSS